MQVSPRCTITRCGGVGADVPRTPSLWESSHRREWRGDVLLLGEGTYAHGATEQRGLRGQGDELVVEARIWHRSRRWYRGTCAGPGPAVSMADLPARSPFLCQSSCNSK
jgi:hypothetical protein